VTIPIVTMGFLYNASMDDLERWGTGAVVVRRCDELAELIAACQSGLARVAVVVGGTADVTMTLSDRLAAVGVGLVCLTDDDAERRRLDSIGLRTGPETLAADELGALIAQAADDARADREHAVSSSFSQPGAPYSMLSSSPMGTDSPVESSEDAVRPKGQILVFWGPIGSPGRTTLAVNIAAELVDDGNEVVLVDADTYGPAVATHLGLLDESAALAQACRLADQGMLTVDAVDRLAPSVVAGTGTLRVLTGLTRPDRWPELRAASFGAVLTICAALADYVVVDAGFCLEADEELSFDTMAPRRNGAALRALELADRIIAVGAADAVGMPRLVRALNDLERAVPRANPEVVFNKIRRASLGRFPERSLREAWDRFGPARAISALIPFDPETADAALFDGQALLESAPHSELRAAIASISCSPTQRNRKGTVSSDRARFIRPR
jgi:MinD-like ATPase involved in chromosome partitioning or flagellar assembly